MPPPLDGTLLSWDVVKDAQPWTGLLLGNGMSVNIWSRFAYDSLYTEARGLGGGSGLTADDEALFTAFKTQNFELVLGELGGSIQVLDALGKDTSELLTCYQSVQAALGDAIRAVHIPWTDVPASTLGRIQEELHQHEWVFTTSYDLLTYWAMGHEDNYGRLVDAFWSADCRFNPKDVDVRARSVPVYFLHGAMHLIAEGSGRTRKLKRTATVTLLDQFGEPIEGDPQARPLLVTEGSSQHKLQAIESNDYLAHAYDRLSNLEAPLVVFGSSLGEQDQHLADALSNHPDRPIAVSMTPGSKTELRAKQRDIFGRLEAEPLLFFNSETHPLGAPDLAVPSP